MSTSMDVDAITHKTMMMYLSRRADYLARRIAEAEAVGRTLTWDRGELLALQAAIGRLERMEKFGVYKPESNNIESPPGGTTT